MIERTEMRRIRKSKRYWSVSIDGNGEYDFRFPYYETAYKVINHVSQCPTGDKSMEGISRMLPYMGAAIGACWYDKHWDLEAKMGDDLAEFGAAVADELQDLDLNLLQIVNLFNEVVGGIKERISVVSEAQETKDFSCPPTGEPTS